MMRLGALAFRDSGNGRRFGHRDSDGNIVDAYGPNLSPVAALIPQLTALADRLARESAERHQLRHALSAARRRTLTAVTCALHDRHITDEVGQVLQDRIITHGARVRPSTPLKTLRRRLAALEDIDAELATLIGWTAPGHATAQADGRQAEPEDREGAGRRKPEQPGDPREGVKRQTTAAVTQPPGEAQDSVNRLANMQGPAKQKASPILPPGKPPYYYNTKDSLNSPLTKSSLDEVGMV